MPGRGVVLKQCSPSVVIDGKILICVPAPQDVAVARMVLLNVRGLSAEMIAQALEQPVAATKRLANVLHARSWISDDVNAVVIFGGIE